MALAVEAGRPGRFTDQAQEKPDLQEQPDSAPAGAADVLPEETRKLEAEIVFLTLPLPHLLHSTSPLSSVEVVRTSKMLLHS